MLSGRHLLFVGALSAAGLASVRDSQDQVSLGYELAQVEIRLRAIREALETERIRLQAMEAPPRIITHVADLKVDVAPASPLALYVPNSTTVGPLKNMPASPSRMPSHTQTR